MQYGRKSVDSRTILSAAWKQFYTPLAVQDEKNIFLAPVLIEII